MIYSSSTIPAAVTILSKAAAVAAGLILFNLKLLTKHLEVLVLEAGHWQPTTTIQWMLLTTLSHLIIKMLVASDVGTIDLLPALPTAWPEGSIEGVLCRGQVELKALTWTPGRIEAELVSAIAQTLVIRLPKSANKANGAVKAGDDSTFSVTLEAGQAAKVAFEGLST